MKTQNLILDSDSSDDINIGLISLTQELDPHEFFFKLNTLNFSSFKRIKDLELKKTYFDYYHPRFEAYSVHFETKIHIIGNQSISSTEKLKSLELFSNESHVNHLLNDHHKINFIIKTEELFDDFSLILLPEEFSLPIETLTLSAGSELHTFFQYYE